MNPKEREGEWVPDWIQVEKARREELKTRYADLFREVSAILFQFDPIGINFEDRG